MLLNLHIQNIAVIEETTVDFSNGLNVLSGETGAGKSILIDAINAVLGERTSREIVRTGSDKASVTALFLDISKDTQDFIEELGYGVDEEGQLLISRTISDEGRSICRINGAPITVGLLSEIGRALVNVHGQFENQALLSPEKHLEYLEVVKNLTPLHSEFSKVYSKYIDAKTKLEDFSIDESLKEQRIEILKFQIEEIEESGLKLGELEELENQREIYKNSEKIVISLENARETLYGGDNTEGALLLLNEGVSELQTASEYLDEIKELLSRTESVMYELEDCVNELRSFSGNFEFEPEDIEMIDDRIYEIRRLLRKYGGNGQSEEVVQEFLDEAKKELEVIEMSDVHYAKLEEEAIKTKKIAMEKAKALSEARKKAGKEFAKEVRGELKFLDMPNVKLAVNIEPTKLTSLGIDNVEFLISVNPGEEPKSIAKIASGGELSRIMLAIKSVLADADDIDTLIFDEIDAGISGRAAQKVGIKLREISKNRQVLCVTHLAQIAAQAHHHYLIDKTVKKGRTFTIVDLLDKKGREIELGRIVSGDVTEASLQAGREMLENAHD